MAILPFGYLEDVMKKFLKVMKALSDPNRVKILKILQRGSMCVCQLQMALGISQPTVSRQLRILEEAGLVVYSKGGLWVNYRLADGAQTPYASSALGQLKHWLEDDPEVKELVKRLPNIDRRKNL